jgi:hypothetical protein
MAELVRLYFSCTVSEAQSIVDGLVQKRVPIIQDFDGYLKTLNPSMTVRERLLVLLYHRGDLGASRAQLGNWLKGKLASTVSKDLSRLESDDLIHRVGSQCTITIRGIIFVEEHIPLEHPVTTAKKTVTRKSRSRAPRSRKAP